MILLHSIVQILIVPMQDLTTDDPANCFRVGRMFIRVLSELSAHHETRGGSEPISLLAVGIRMIKNPAGAVKRYPI
jgi:hypothetical protein